MRPTALIAAALVLMAAACSSDSDPASTTAATPSTAATSSSTSSASSASSASPAPDVPLTSTSGPDASTTSIAGAPASSDGSPTSAPDVPQLTEDQRRVVQLVIDNSTSSGFVFDENCIGGLVAQLDEADIATLLSAGADPEAEPPLERLTPEGQAVLTTGIVACISGR